MGLPRPDAGTPVHDYLAQHRSQMVILNWPCVRGDWVTADLVAPSDLHLLLGVLDHPLLPEQIRTIRRARDASPPARDQDPVQIAVMERILVVVAHETTSPPDWPEIIERLQ